MLYVKEAHGPGILELYPRTGLATGYTFFHHPPRRYDFSRLHEGQFTINCNQRGAKSPNPWQLAGEF